MKPFKALSRNQSIRRTVCWLAARYIRLVHSTSRWTVIGGAIPQAYWDADKPFILCFWHNRILMMMYNWQRGRKIHMLISSHPDGQLIAQTVAEFGIDTVTGSSTRGGAQGVRSLIRLIKGGGCVGITPDGPSGPRMRAANGVVVLARLSGVPMIPCSYSTSNRKLARSWDRFVIAYPFSRGAIVWGEPISVPSDADDVAMERARQALEDSLNAVSAEADRLCGQPPIEPAPMSEIREAKAS